MIQTRHSAFTRWEARKIAHVLGSIFAILAAGCGLVTLAGWIVDAPLLATWASDRMPMAPSTAAIFLAYGVAVFLHARASQNSQARRLAVVLGAVATGAAALLLVLSYLGIRPDFEHLGLRIAGTLNGVPVGHISSLTALCLVVAGAAFLALLSSSPARRWPAMAGSYLASLVSSTGMVLLLAYLSGAPVLYGKNVVPPAMNAAVAILMLGLSILAFSRYPTWSGSIAAEATGPRAPGAFILLFVAAAVGIVATGHFYQRNYEKNYRSRVESELLTVFRSEADELAGWRQERLGDARLFHRNPGFTVLATRVLDQPQDATARAQLGAWLDGIAAHAECDRVILLDAGGVNRMSAPAKNEPVDVPILREAPAALESGEIRVVDLYLCEHDGRIYLAVLVPILTEQPHRKVGVLALCIDPAKSLYPRLSGWPTPSPTAETLLVRREGNDVVSLSELKFRKGSALTFRLPLTRTELPAVKAALGRKGVVEGVDYRGAATIAAVGAVPDSPWFLVARIDTAEVYQPLREHLWLTVMFIGILLLSAAGGLLLVWRQQSLRIFADKIAVTEALRASEELLGAVANNTPDAIFVKDRQSRLLFANPATLAVMGKSAQEALGRTDAEIFADPEMASQLMATDRRIMDSGQSEVLEEIVGPPENERLFLSTKSPRRDAEGRVVGVVGVARDITERKRAEESLRLTRVSVEYASDAMFWITPDARIVDVNEAACRSLGYCREELLQLTVPDIDAHYNAEKWPSHFSELRQRGSLQFESEQRAKDGRLIPVDIAANYVKFGDEERNCAFVRDITERKRTEALLLHAQKMEAIGQLAGGVAHDFRNQLTVIQGFAEMLLRRNLVKEEGRDKLELILKAAERSATTTGQLLAYSRRETLSPSVQSLGDGVAAIGKVLSHMIAEDIHLAIRSDGHDTTAKVDAHLFQQAIMNLATNARDAMPKGGTLTIETTCVTLGPESRQIDPDLAAGPYVIVSVRDTGAGMDRETLAKAFDPFFTTKGLAKGTGLGLAMVYGFVKQSGGAIALESQPGRGTTVRLYFPQLAPASAQTPPAQGAPAIQGGSETVLLVEDEAPVLDMAAQLLQDAGYRVLQAASGEEALSLTDRHGGTVDLLVSDIVMPGMSGVDLAKQLRGRYPGMGVVFVSGYPGEELSKRGVSDTADVLLKPFTSEALLTKVRQALDARRAAPGA